MNKMAIPRTNKELKISDGRTGYALIIPRRFDGPHTAEAIRADLARCVALECELGMTLETIRERIAQAKRAIKRLECENLGEK